MKKVLYHVSTDIHHNGVFTPRIPEYKFDFEDKTTKRVCVSSTIEGCLSALPSKECIEENGSGYIKLFQIDLEALGLSEEVLDDVFLYENGLLDDSLVTNEHWITAPFKVPEENQTICKLSFIESTSRKVIPYKDIQRIKNDFLIDITESIRRGYIIGDEEDISYKDVMEFAEIELEELCENYISVTYVYNYNLCEENIVQTQEIYFNGDYLDNLFNFVQEKFSTSKVIQHYAEEVCIQFPSGINIREVFAYDYQQFTNMESA